MRGFKDGEECLTSNLVGLDEGIFIGWGYRSRS